ncbi:MAG: hypothetical protein ACTSW1_01135 [Candidatus Hodarchaeales archaeon]
MTFLLIAFNVNQININLQSMTIKNVIQTREKYETQDIALTDQDNIHLGVFTFRPYSQYLIILQLEHSPASFNNYRIRLELLAFLANTSQIDVFNRSFNVPFTPVDFPGGDDLIIRMEDDKYLLLPYGMYEINIEEFTTLDIVCNITARGTSGNARIIFVEDNDSKIYNIKRKVNAFISRQFWLEQLFLPFLFIYVVVIIDAHHYLDVIKKDENNVIES